VSPCAKDPLLVHCASSSRTKHGAWRRQVRNPGVSRTAQVIQSKVSLPDVQAPGCGDELAVSGDKSKVRSRVRCGEQGVGQFDGPQVPPVDPVEERFVVVVSLCLVVAVCSAVAEVELVGNQEKRA
jgi:hypothetical protein